MEGGIAILLLLIIVVAALGIGAALYFTGGALWFSRTKSEGDDPHGPDGRFERPEHKDVSSPTIENTHVVGTSDDER